jgi:hypothetical protein
MFTFKFNSPTPLNKYKLFQFVFFLSVTFMIGSCKKREATDWDTNLLGPIFKTSLGIDHILPDSLTQINSDNSVSIVYDDNFNSSGFVNTQQLPDTAIVKYFTIPFGSIFLNAGDNFLDQTEETKLNFEPLELSRLIVKTGEIEVKIINKINQPVDVTYILPKALKNGLPYTFSATIPAYNSSNGGNYSATFYLDGYDVDLRGISGAHVNRLVTHLIANISSTATGLAQIFSTDSLLVSLKLKSIVPYYAKGYFGQSKDTSNTNSGISLFDRIVAGNFSLQEAKLNLDIKNGIGADVRASLLSFKSINNKTGNVVPLQHSSVAQTFNVHRATDSPFTPSLYSFEYNNTNSNLVSLLENMPTNFTYSYATELNPFGNISNGNDFVYTDKAVDAHVRLDIPLHFSSTNLTLVDTIYLQEDSIGEHNTVKSAVLKLLAVNSFPFDADVKFYLLDNNLLKQEQLMDETTIMAAKPDADGRVRTTQESRLPITINNELLNKLLEKRKVLAVVTINTYENPMKYKIYSDYKLDLKLTGNLFFNVQVK